MAIQATSGPGAAVYSAQSSKGNENSEKPQAAADRPAPTTKDTNSSGSKESILNPKDRVEISQAALSHSQDREAVSRWGLMDADEAHQMMQRAMAKGQRETAAVMREDIKLEQNRLAVLEKTPPVPAVKLNDDEVQAVIKALKESGAHPSFLPDQENIFYLGGQLYNFKPDGSVYRNESGVPTSEEQKQGWIEADQESINKQLSILEEWGV